MDIPRMPSLSKNCTRWRHARTSRELFLDLVEMLRTKVLEPLFLDPPLTEANVVAEVKSFGWIWLSPCNDGVEVDEGHEEPGDDIPLDPPECQLRDMQALLRTLVAHAAGDLPRQVAQAESQQSPAQRLPHPGPAPRLPHLLPRRLGLVDQAAPGAGEEVEEQVPDRQPRQRDDEEAEDDGVVQQQPGRVVVGDPSHLQPQGPEREADGGELHAHALQPREPVAGVACEDAVDRVVVRRVVVEVLAPAWR
mmetsp:Transcript_49767/g.142395  ORF Transcript_49767/g.142395 Transcript_49767/m.142395 type:complete len:250 (+) Transcript_49767:318-1067(+)